MNRKRTPEERKERARAVAIAGAAMRAGRLLKPTTCSNCGGDDYIEGHHEDYSSPLDITWLCFRCHRRRHEELDGAHTRKWRILTEYARARLGQECNQRGLQAPLAAKLGISSAHMTNIVRHGSARRTIGERMLGALAAHWGISAEQILSFAEDFDHGLDLTAQAAGCFPGCV